MPILVQAKFAYLVVMIRLALASHLHKGKGYKVQKEKFAMHRQGAYTT
jgi:hypothetical protein